MREIITISREFGSGGAIIGKLIAEKNNMPLYDREIIDMAVAKSGLSKDVIESAELRAVSAFSYSFTSALSFTEGYMADPISVNDKIFLTQYDVIRQIAEQEKAVIVGRCADYVLKDLDFVTNIFLYANLDDRIERSITQYGIKADKAKHIIKEHDKARRNYYNYHTSQKWGSYENYHLALNTSYLSDEQAAEAIIKFVQNRIYK